MRKTLSGLLTAGLALSLAACGSAEGIGVKANMGATVGIAMPTRVSERWIADGDNMVTQFQGMGYQANLKFADDDVKLQRSQIKTMVDEGNKLLVIGAVDGGALNDVLAEAKQKDISVIAYDRLLTNTKDVDYQATFDNIRVGEMQGQLLVDRLGLSKGEDGPFNVEFFAGSPTDINAVYFHTGALNILKPYLDEGKIVIRSNETDFTTIATRDYDAYAAGTRMKKLDGTHYRNASLHAVLSPYDGMSIGIINALKERGYGSANKPLPIVSGQDAEIPSVKSILAGEQTATIYKDTRELAKVAVQMGNSLLTGSMPIVNDTTTFDNGVKLVPTYLLYPVAVDEKNYKALLVDGGYYKEEELTGTDAA